MAEGLANFSETYLVGAINNSTTTVIVNNGSVLPTVPFYLVVEAEIMRVTAKSTNTLTVVRAQEGTSAASHASSQAAYTCMTVQTLKNAIADYSTLSNFTASTGSTLYRGASAWAVLNTGGATTSSLFSTNGAAANPSWVTLTSRLDTVGTTVGSILYRGSSAWQALSPAANNSFALSTNGSGADPSYITTNPRAAFGGRLSLESGVSVSVSSQTAKTTLYAVPHNGSMAEMSKIWVYNTTTTVWEKKTFSNTSLSLSGFTASLPYDIFGYFSGGTFTLDAVAWSTASARATSLATQDGIYVKSGSADRLYLGTILITSTTGQCEFSFNARPSFFGIWNMYNRVRFSTTVIDPATSWTYASATWRPGNNSTSNRVTIVAGLQEEVGTGWLDNIMGAAASSDASTCFGFDSTSAVAGATAIAYVEGSTTSSSSATISNQPSIGSHFYQWLEARINGAGTNTYYGTSTAGTSSLNVQWTC